jgi:L-ascorbate metabolism protein UlaG (beta-lactamase superfamily)
LQITWFGHAAFGLTDASGFSVITDPYTPGTTGYAPISDSADLVLLSSEDDAAHGRADLIAGDPIVLNALTVARAGGSGEAAGLEVHAIQALERLHHPQHDIPGQNALYRFVLDGIRFAHMGDAREPLGPAQQEFLGDTDVLFAPAGGEPNIALPDLVETIHQVRPRLVIPMQFRTLCYRPGNLHWIERFLSYFRNDSVDFAFGPKITLDRGALPGKTRVTVMDYLR